jgi:hypothetical protein
MDRSGQLRYVTCSTQQGVGTPLGANERLIGGYSGLKAAAQQLSCMAAMHAGSAKQSKDDHSGIPLYVLRQ